MNKCRDYALNLLTICDRTEKEIRDKLRGKGYPGNEIEDTIIFLSEYGYINDREYVRKYIKDAVNIKKWGKKRIETELLKKGADRYVVEEMLEEIETDFGALIMEILKSRFKNSNLSDPKERNRIFSYFARRGFSPQDIAGSINKLSDNCMYDDF